ncbi:MAG: glycosyltransferase [Patescibacteria group bacterium]
MKPFFSIIIPTLNEEDYLPKLLTDLTKQTQKGFEVIVADGNSKDNTKKEVKKFKNTLNIKFYQTKLTNVATQRNFGVSKSMGQYIIFLDADIGLKPSFINKLTSFIKKQKGLVIIPYLAPEKGDEEYKPLFDIGNLLVEFSQNMTKKFSLGGSMIFEKNFFNIIGGFDHELYTAEDHELIQKAYSWGVSPKIMKENGITFSLRRWKKEGNLKVIYKYFLTTAYRLFGGEIKNKIIEYKMGGAEYKEIKKLESKKTFISNSKKIIKQIRKALKALVE